MLTTVFLAAMLTVNADMVSHVTEVDVQADSPARVLTVAGPPVAVGEVSVNRTIYDLASEGTTVLLHNAAAFCHPHEMPHVSPVSLDAYLRGPVILTPVTGD